MTATVAVPPRRYAPATRKAILSAHIVLSVGLLGDVAVYLAVAIRAAATSDPQLAEASYELLAMFGIVFGIPLSFGSLLSGLALGLGTKWGVLRYPWVVAKLLLILSVVLVGALVLGPSAATMQNGGGDREAILIAGSAWDVLALTVATVLSVHKPGRKRSRPGPHNADGPR